jgi:hypothetical protein
MQRINLSVMDPGMSESWVCDNGISHYINGYSVLLCNLKENFQYQVYIAIQKYVYSQQYIYLRNDSNFSGL